MNLEWLLPKAQFSDCNFILEIDVLQNTIYVILTLSVSIVEPDLKSLNKVPVLVLLWPKPLALDTGKLLPGTGLPLRTYSSELFHKPYPKYIAKPFNKNQIYYLHNFNHSKYENFIDADEQKEIKKSIELK